MTTYQVFTDGGELAVEMEADSKESPPTKISGPDWSLVEYAKELVSKPPHGQVTSVEAIASRMGRNSYLVRKGETDEPSEAEGERVIVEAMQHLDDERLEILARRARFLLAEMWEEQQAKN